MITIEQDYDPGGNRPDARPNFELDRQAAIIWARAILETDFVILDTETTGISYDDEAVSIGLVSKAGEILLDTLLCHDKPSDLKAALTHGITWEQTRRAPTFLEIAPRLFDLIGGRDVVGYNVTFDLRIIGQMVVRYNVADVVPEAFAKMPPAMAHDVMGAFAMFYGDWDQYHRSYTWKKLTYAAAYLGIPTEGAHGAAADALMTLRVIEAMAAEKVRGE